MRLKQTLAVSLLFGGSLVPSFGATSTIGIVSANGPLQIDGSKVGGNSTLLSGSVLQTGSAPSTVHLTNGSRLDIAADSRGKIYSDHVLLEKGGVVTGNQYEVDAQTLKIKSADSNASARVSVNGKAVVVAALTGNFRVTNSKGVVVANLVPGRAMEFTPLQQGATGSSPSTMIGCVTKSGSVYTLTDETSNVTVELRGADVNAHVGHRIQVTGTSDSGTAAGGASQVVNVSKIKMLGRGCSSKVGAAGAAGAAAGAGAAGAGAAAAGAAAAGVSAASAVVAGIAVAAAVGTAAGVAATSSGNGTGTGVTPVSR